MVHAASIHPVDVKKAAGALKIVVKDEYVAFVLSMLMDSQAQKLTRRNRSPYKTGFDCAVVIEEIGTEVSNFEVGDEAYTRLPERYRGQSSSP